MPPPEKTVGFGFGKATQPKRRKIHLWAPIPTFYGGRSPNRLKRFHTVRDCRAKIAKTGSKSHSVSSGASGAYEACESLSMEGERSFFGVLDQALAGEYRLFAKVRLADVVHPVQGPSRSGRQAAFNRISAKHVDFVLCVPASLRVVGVVELDDKSHRRLYRGLRDGLVDAALAGAGIPTIRVVARPTYSPVQLRDEVSRAVRPQRAVGRPAKG